MLIDQSESRLSNYMHYKNIHVKGIYEDISYIEATDQYIKSNNPYGKWPFLHYGIIARFC